MLTLSGRRATVRVGVFGDAGQHGGSGDTVADIATKHEFGLGVPRRSFIADYVDENEPELRRRLADAARMVALGHDLEVVLERFGLQAVGEIVERIVRGIEPPNSPLTIERKGSSTPLVNTGQLKASITSKVDG